MISWNELLKDKEDKALFFNDIHTRFTAIRDHVAAVSYAIPAKLQANYQHQLTQLQQLYEAEKEKAIPKKKFTFARKTPVV